MDVKVLLVLFCVSLSVRIYYISINQYRLHPIFINRTNCSSAHTSFSISLLNTHCAPYTYTFKGKNKHRFNTYLFILHSTCNRIREKTSHAHRTSTHSFFSRKLKHTFLVDSIFGVVFLPIPINNDSI